MGQPAVEGRAFIGCGSTITSDLTWHYFDELPDDVGEIRLRKSGLLGPFGAVLAPCVPADYSEVVE